MPDIMFTLDANGKRLYSELQKSERKVDQLEKKLTSSGKGAATGFGKAASSAKQMGLAISASILGTSSLEGVIQAIVAQVKKGIQEIREMQQDAKREQRTWADEVGNFLANNPQLSTAEQKNITDFAQTEGGKLGEKGAPSVLRAMTEMRSSNPNTDMKTQMEAMRLAIKQKMLDNNTNMAEFSTAVIKIQQAMGGDMQKAADVLARFGSLAGGDVATLSKHISGLKGARAAAGNTPMEDILALFGFTTAATGDKTGDESSTLVSNMITRISSKDFKIGGKKIKFKTDNAVERIKDIVKRIESGEFGDKSKAYAELRGGLGRDSAGAAKFFGAVANDMKGLQTTQDELQETSKGGMSFQDKQLAAKEELAPGEKGRKETEAAEGASAGSARGDLTGAAWAETDAQLEEFDDEYGITSDWDFGRGVRRWSTNKTPQEYKEGEKRRRLREELKGRSVLPRGANPYAFLNSEDDLAREGLLHGVVNPDKGLDRLEKKVLSASGADAVTIQNLEKLFLKGQKEAFTEAVDTLVAKLQKMQTNPTAQEVD